MLPAIEQALPPILELKYGPPDGQGPQPRLRAQYGYSVPADLYEAFVFSIVTPNTRWLDVGSGRSPFPGNLQAARQLAERCALLVGIDPSDNIHTNDIVHQRHQCLLEDFAAEQPFDLVTLRMVAEHITTPESALAALARLTAPEGRVVLLTVNKWSPASIAAALTPMSVHRRAKKLLWNAHEEDAFPVAYKMNTRGALKTLFETAGFREELFYWVDDCQSLTFSDTLLKAELTLRTWLRRIRLRYPELCILASYKRA